jgi:hypothetical protein
MHLPKSLTASLLSLSLFAGCQTSDPSTQVEKTAQRATSNANAAQLIKTEFTPLMPLCFASVEQGASADPSTLAALGFSKSLGAYTKKRGTQAIDRLNLANTGFKANGKICHLSLGNFFGVQQAGAFMRAQLAARGYTAGASSKKGFAYTKGGTTLYLNGFSIQTTTSVSLTKG